MKRIKEFIKTYNVSISIIIAALSIIVATFIIRISILQAVEQLGTSIFMS